MGIHALEIENYKQGGVVGGLQIDQQNACR